MKKKVRPFIMYTVMPVFDSLIGPASPRDNCAGSIYHIVYKPTTRGQHKPVPGYVDVCGPQLVNVQIGI